jgi:GrpB-like predicted nucleotidyltransferase (UPF0157 family)
VIDEPVHLEAHQPAWAPAFEGERTLLAAALVEPALQHIGSTAVPGLVAKPVIDLMLGVSELPPSAETVAAVVACGYEALGEQGVPGRLYFRKRSATRANLHVVLVGGAHWHNNLALRDHLRSNPAARERYAAAKEQAVRSGANTSFAYSEAKSAAVELLLQESCGAKSSTP